MTEQVTDTDEHPLMTPGEVGALMRVDPKTVTRWANAGRLGPVVRTPGRHLRIWRSNVKLVVDGYIFLIPLPRDGAAADAAATAAP